MAAVTKKGSDIKKKMKKDKSEVPNTKKKNGKKPMRKKTKDDNENEGLFEDPRFAHLQNDTRYKPIQRKQRTVKIDKRFQRMLTDSSFAEGHTLDKNQEGSNEMSRLYQMEGDDDEESSKKKSKKQKDLAYLDEKFAIDYSRGEVLLESSDDEDEGSDLSDNEEEDGMDVWGGGYAEAHEKVPMMEESEFTKRLAVCNLDWTKLHAKDLFVLANSFKPASGSIQSVTIYPSDFGLERMAEEDAHGPGKFLTSAEDKEEELNQTEEEKQIAFMDEGREKLDDIDQEKLRAYEMSKLRYYYAVVVCDSVETASTIYKACDGHEFEKSRNIMDIRFIPDDVEFENEPKEICDDMPNPEEINEKSFETNALAHSNVKFTWDEEDKDAQAILKKKSFTQEELEKTDFSAFLQSESEDELSDNDERKEKVKALLQSCKEAEEAENNKGDLQITWDLGLKEKTEQLLRDREEKLEEKNMNVGELLEKKRKLKSKERKRAIKEKLAKAKKGNMEDSEDDEMNERRVGGDDPFFKLSAEDLAELGLTEKQLEEQKHEKNSENQEDSVQKKTKGKKRKQKKDGKAEAKDDFKVDVADPRFSAVFDRSEYYIDPTQPAFKNTDQMRNLIKERQKRRRKNNK
eukprot:m.149252 g.149252  ORF g.149252 m.149252 type:complete len:630 (+) comp15009_c0_seq2:204-2093(+)